MTTPTVALRITRAHPADSTAALLAARLVAALNGTRAVELDHVDDTTIVLRVAGAPDGVRAEVTGLLAPHSGKGWHLCPD